ncbi:hypothetical protein ANCCAN_25621 [Ancylostoma caninum]|uniref:ABC transporter family G domain-containing protein n=1 Tax=Ancylostoma caninum TaxID=29170 RepID=A0A368FCS9_ANCCA|nr:hypothetical protein ANCCAN_25621 [Ancylostoma caninum]
MLATRSPSRCKRATPLCKFRERIIEILDWKVVTALRLMADKGKTVVTVIHQPGSQIFTMFHRVCFMALGKTAYHGTVKDLIKFFASLGDPTLRVPESYNPADHVIAKLSVSKDTTDEDVERVEFITAMFHESIMGDELRELIWAGSTKLEIHNEEEHERHKHRYAVSMCMQMNVLFRRAFLTTIRDPVLLQVRILQVVVSADLLTAHILCNDIPFPIAMQDAEKVFMIKSVSATAP